MNCPSRKANIGLGIPFQEDLNYWVKIESKQKALLLFIHSLSHWFFNFCAWGKKKMCWVALTRKAVRSKRQGVTENWEGREHLKNGNRNHVFRGGRKLDSKGQRPPLQNSMGREWPRMDSPEIALSGSMVGGRGSETRWHSPRQLTDLWSSISHHRAWHRVGV